MSEDKKEIMIEGVEELEDLVDEIHLLLSERTQSIYTALGVLEVVKTDLINFGLIEDDDDEEEES